MKTEEILNCVLAILIIVLILSIICFLLAIAYWLFEDTELGKEIRNNRKVKYLDKWR